MYKTTSIVILAVAIGMGTLSATLARTWLNGQAELARQEAALAPRPRATGLEDGERALVVSVESASQLKPGERADVVMVRKGYAKTILSNAKVIALDKDKATLAVAAGDAPKVLLAENVGKLSLTARDPEDASMASASATDAELSPDQPVVVLPTKNTVTVTVIRAGKPTQYEVKKG